MEKSVAGESIVGTFVDHLEFKRKKVGGVDEMDALGKIEELAGLYEERIEALNREVAQAKRDAEAAVKRAESTATVEAALARAKAELAEERTRAEGLAARLRALESAPAAPAAISAAPVADDFMRTLQEVRADVLAKARDEASAIVARARDSADSAVRAEHERRTRAAEAARTARSQAESAMRKLADALGDVEALESELSGGSGSEFNAQEVLSRLRRADVPNPLDPWDSSSVR